MGGDLPRADHPFYGGTHVGSDHPFNGGDFYTEGKGGFQGVPAGTAVALGPKALVDF